ncbi:unnamed protein product [Boreogadus saida]
MPPISEPRVQPSIGDGVQADPVRLRLAQLNGSPKEKQMLSSGMSLRSALRPPAAVAQTAAVLSCLKATGAMLQCPPLSNATRCGVNRGAVGGFQGSLILAHVILN